MRLGKWGYWFHFKGSASKLQHEWNILWDYTWDICHTDLNRNLSVFLLDISNCTLPGAGEMVGGNIHLEKDSLCKNLWHLYLVSILSRFNSLFHLWTKNNVFKVSGLATILQTYLYLCDVATPWTMKTIYSLVSRSPHNQQHPFIPNRNKE